MMTSRCFCVRLLPTVVLLIACSRVQASIWVEVGDAGDSLATANFTLGVGSLDAIVGTLPDDDPNNVDLFALFIPDLSLFSATTDNYPATDLLDTWLYLFDASGRGIAASATTVGGSTNATISLGSVSGPAGLYYLAITRFETVPESLSGPIFPDLFLDSTDGEVLGPAGPGGADPLAGWSAFPLLDFANYQIDLTGAQPAAIPEPVSLAVWLLLPAFLGTAGIRHRLGKAVSGQRLS